MAYDAYSMSVRSARQAMLHGALNTNCSVPRHRENKAFVRALRKIAWPFLVDGKPVDVITSGGYTCSEDVLGIVTMAMARSASSATPKARATRPAAMPKRGWNFSVEYGICFIVVL